MRVELVVSDGIKEFTEKLNRAVGDEVPDGYFVQEIQSHFHKGSGSDTYTYNALVIYGSVPTG